MSRHFRLAIVILAIGIGTHAIARVEASMQDRSAAVAPASDPAEVDSVRSREDRLQLSDSGAGPFGQTAPSGRDAR